MSKAHKGRKLSPEAYAKLCARELVITPEWRAKMAAGNVGRKRSEEARRNMSEAAKRRAPQSQETRLKISATLKRLKGVSCALP